MSGWADGSRQLGTQGSPTPRPVRSRGRRRPRVALYGHDTLGLGHLRRNLALAGAMTRIEPAPDILVLTGAVESGAYRLPTGVDLVTLPGISKDPAGRYRSRRLGLALDELTGMRAAVLTAALTSFAPDLLVVDKVALGFDGELEPALRQLREAGGTRVVLGLRDILDDPQVASREWRTSRSTETVRAYYDQIWVYGDRRVHDLAAACAIPPALARRTHYTGYLSRGRCGTPVRPPMVRPGRRYALCALGGGSDGGGLAGTFAAARMPGGTDGVLVTGSQMDARTRRDLDQLVAGREDLHLVDFTSDLTGWLAGASAAVTMGGYNSIAELLDTDVPALVVPRCVPRLEQRVRALALGTAGYLDWADPADLSPQTLTTWLREAVTQPPKHRGRRDGIALDGLSTVTTLAGHLIGAARTGARDVAV